MKEEKLYCAHCGSLILGDNYEEVGGEIGCTDCAERYAVHCDRCGSLIWESDSYGDEYITICECCRSHYVLQKLTQALANAAEERGTDASGISYIKDGKVTIFKRPKPAHKVKFNVPDGTKAVIGHTRLTTQGNQKHNYNNHPFPGHADKDFAFAHNGVLYNDDTLRKEKQLPQTHIETDSYVAVQLIQQQGKLDFNSLKSMAEDVRGTATAFTF